MIVKKKVRFDLTRKKWSEMWIFAYLDINIHFQSYFSLLSKISYSSESAIFCSWTSSCFTFFFLSFFFFSGTQQTVKLKLIAYLYMRARHPLKQMMKAPPTLWCQIMINQASLVICFSFISFCLHLVVIVVHFHHLPQILSSTTWSCHQFIWWL